MAGTTTVANLQANLSLNTSGFSTGVNNAAGATDDLTKSILQADLVKGALQGVATFANKVVQVVDKSVKNFASYEQLTGGVETLFKESSDQVIKNAQKAYVTAGMDANKYMETVTSFSASLLSSLGGDTEEAAKIADMAITDMSDNANKMGTSIESIQTAYQGFAKQNYTMLDNLKLGYGGTKTEMERLLKDAEKLSGQKYDISNLNDVFEAIHVIQTEFDITGTTAKEAATTIEGSGNQMKAAWENLLTSMVTGGDWFDESVQAFIDSAVTYVENLLPAIEGALEGFAALVSTVVPIIVDELPGFVEKVLPDILKSVTDIIEAVGKAIPGLIGTLIDIIPLIVDEIVKLMEDIDVSNLLPGAISIVTKLATALTDAIPTLMTKFTEFIMGIASGIVDSANNTDLSELLNVAVTLITGIADGLVASIKIIYEKLPEIITGIVKWFTNPENIGDLLSAAIDLFANLVSDIPGILIAMGEGLAGIITGIKDYFTNNGETLGEGFKEMFSGLKDKLLEAWTEKIKPAFDELGNKIREFLSKFEWGGAILTFANKLKNGIIEKWELVKGAFTGATGLFGKIGSWFSEFDLSKIITDFIQKIKDAIEGAWDSFKTWFQDKISGLFSGIKVPNWIRKIFGKGDGEGGGAEDITQMDAEDEMLVDMPENLITLDYSSLQPIPEDTLKSYQALADAVIANNNAITGEGENTGLNAALAGLPALLDNIRTAAANLATYLSGDFIAAITAMLAIVCVASTDEEGNVTAGGGNTLYNALGSVYGLFKDILATSRLLAEHWTGEFIAASTAMRTEAGTASGVVQSLANTAQAAADEFISMATAIYSVIDAYIALQTVKGGSSRGGGKTGKPFESTRAEGGPVNANDTYLVGEEGPELFRANRSGWITNHDDLMSAVGSRDQVITVNFNGDVIGDERSISAYVTKAVNKGLRSAVYAGS